MCLSTLISVSELRDLIAADAVIVLDCRFYLQEPTRAVRDYAAGHIPGAIFVDLHHQLAGPEKATTGRHPLPAPEHFAEQLQQWGIDGQKPLVMYDDMGGAFAARAWWMLSQQGLSCRVLDGGFAKWSRTEAIDLVEHRGLPCSQRLTVAFPWAVTETEVVQNFETDVFQLVDARAADRFNGENETLDPIGGHIPGALNRPFAHNLADNGDFKPAAILQQEWQTRLAGIEQPIVNYCGSGVTACHNVLALNHAGINARQVYIGSWSQWAKRLLGLMSETP